MARYLAERERQSFEGRIRLSVYHACGGDGELRCQQYAPRDLRGIEPTIPLSALECQETGARHRRIRRCSFALGYKGGNRITCRVTLREAAGPHSLYWAEDAPVPPPVRSAEADRIPRVPGSHSSLVCSAPLLGLTEEPEAVDPAPATAPRAVRDLATLIRPDDHPMGAGAEADGRTVRMKLQIGSHGRIDRCTVTRSSGSRDVDVKACRLLRTRARFVAARNAEGKPVAAEILHSHVWRVPR